jgi:hypothetical protein
VRSQCELNRGAFSRDSLSSLDGTSAAVRKDAVRPELMAPEVCAPVPSLKMCHLLRTVAP